MGEEEQSIPAEHRTISRDDGASIIDASVYEVVFDDYVQYEGSIHILHQKKEVPYEEISPHILQKIRMGRQMAEYISMNT